MARRLLYSGALLFLVGVALVPIFVFLHQDLTAPADATGVRPFRNPFVFQRADVPGRPAYVQTGVDRWFQVMLASALFLLVGAASLGASLVARGRGADIGSILPARDIARGLLRRAVAAFLLGAVGGILTFAFLEVPPNAVFSVLLLAFVVGTAIYAWRRGPSLYWLRATFSDKA
ncbi:MAG: hypothetical protein FJX64_07850 [Alphaproteobacteria bacterium]|nr:hypothetical protein [Alphaproteobacteria bacterium]